MTRLVCLLLAGLLLSACVSTSKGPHPRQVPPGHNGSFTSWWSDSVKREVGTYRGGLRHGDVRAYHQDGSLALKGRFAEGLPVGELRRYHPGGQLAVVEQVEDGALTGLREEWDREGRRVGEREYRDGRKWGAERQWYPDGTLKLEGRWKADLPVGRWLHHTPKGDLATEEFYWLAEGRPVGYLETTYAAGLAVSQSLMHREDEAWVGWTTTWYDNGVQQGLMDIRDGRQFGRDVKWSRAGRKLSEGQRVDDLREGPWIFYDESGLPSRTVWYEAGVEVEAPGGEPPAPPPTARND